jgi:hypothetical protein
MGEWLESERLKREFYVLLAIHIVLWCLAVTGIVFLYSQAQKMSPVEAYTASGTPAWGTPMPLGTADTIQKRNEFVGKHLKSVVECLFMRTEKGYVPELKYYTDPGLLVIMNRGFSFAGAQKGGYSQTLQINDFEEILHRPTRRVYRLHGILSSHSLEASANTPIYLLVAMDQRQGNEYNPTGWVVWAIKAISEKQFYAKETAELVDEVTKVNQPKENTDTSVENK